tara:strand:+ start:139 stop:849 length:711 start_codon:yes stop_codon:yes gene_type:complete
MRLALTNSINRYAGGAWTPNKLSSLLHWYRKDTDILESDGSRAEDGDDITQWSDQKGSNHLTASNNFYQFDEDSGGVSSEDSSNDKLNFTNQLNFSGQFSMYMRVKLSTISGSSTDLFFYDADTSSQDFFRVQSTSEFRGKIDNSLKIGFSTTVETGTYYNIGIERDGTNRVSFFLNGASQTQITTTGYETGVVSGTLDIDAVGGNLDGIIKEIVIVNAALSTSDRTKLNNYLTAI